MPVVVGLGGYAKAGKDATADVLEKQGWKRTKMSQDLEQALLILNPWVYVNPSNWKDRSCPEEHNRLFRIMPYVRYKELHALVGYDESKNCNDVRDLLQKLGTEVGRNFFGQTCWIDARMKEVDGWLAEGYNVAITGIRYQNELDAVMERGFGVWIERPGIGPVNAHSSDNALSASDFGINFYNDGTLEELEKLVIEWLGSGFQE